MNDRECNELLAKLRDIPLQGDAPNIGHLMYQCGFAAGKQQASSHVSLPSVRMVAAVAALLMIGLIIGRWNSNAFPDTEQQVNQKIASQEPRSQLIQTQNPEFRSSSHSSLIALQSMLLTNEESYSSINGVSPMGQSGDVLTASGLKQRNDILN